MTEFTGAGVLLLADARRLAARIRRPGVAGLVGAVLPVVLLLAGVWGVGRAVQARIETPEDGSLLGFLVGGPVAFLAYATLFRGADDAFLRRLGIPPRSLYLERSLRLLAWALALVALATYGFGAAGIPSPRVLAVALPAGIVAWGLALWGFSAAARAMAGPGRDRGWGILEMGMWDRELARAAPLVYAPLLPLLAAGIGGAATVASGWSWVPPALQLAVGFVAGHLGKRSYAAALPRFAPQALEMTFVPAVLVEGGELRARRGLSRLLPRRASAAWARDALIAERRHAWASRVTWPAVILCFFALARWGTEPAARGWVAAAVLLVLALQGAAAVRMGRAEGGGVRWLDRAAGLSQYHRFLGRWAWGWGLSLWLLVPVALAWGWWTGAGPGWPWIGVGAASAALAAAASLAAGGR